MSSELYDVEYEKLVNITPLAWLLQFDDGREVWLPKSRCNVSHTDGGKGILTAPGWLLDEREIHYDEYQQ